MTRKKSDICPENVGELFTDGEDYFTLLSCETEPRATIQRLYPDDSGESERIEKPLAEFNNLVLVKPVRPIEKQRKPRADKGTSHKTSKKKETIVPVDDGVALAQEVDDVVIHTPQGEETDYVVSIRGCEGRARELRLAVMEAVNQWGLDVSELSEHGRQQIQAVLGKEKIKKEGN